MQLTEADKIRLASILTKTHARADAHFDARKYLADADGFSYGNADTMLYYRDVGRLAGMCEALSMLGYNATHDPETGVYTIRARA